MINNKDYFLIFKHHLNLIIVEKSIHETEKLMPKSSIYHLMDLRQWIAVLGVNLVQIDEVIAHVPLFVCHLDQDNFRQPIQVHYFSNEASFE